MKYSLLCVVLLAALSACGKDKGKDAPKSTEPAAVPGKTPEPAKMETPTGAAAVAAKKVDICSLLTPEEATEAMGEEMKLRAGGGETNCIWEPKDEASLASIDVTLENDGPTFMQVHSKMQGAVEVTGVGDRATWNGSGTMGQLAFAKGTNGVLITLKVKRDADPRAAAEKIAAKVIGRL